MTLMWTIIVWLALQLPLGVLIGQFIKFGMGEPERARRRARAPGTRLAPAR